MAFAFSAEAQEFIPQTAPSKPKLCTSLSVDAAIFIPIHVNNNNKVQRENSSPSIGKKVNKSSTVQRRGRFAQVDSRSQVSKQSFDHPDKTPPDEKPSSNDNNFRQKKSQPHKDVVGHNKLKQSFSLEYAKQQKHTAIPRSVDDNTDIINIPMNRTPLNFTSNSGESKPIILWSSIVKKEASDEKNGDDVNQAPSVRSKSLTDEASGSSKKYSKNKVTRTKNVLSEPPNDKFGHRPINKVAFQKADQTFVEAPKFSNHSCELVSDKTDMKSQVGELSNNFSQKHAAVMKNSKRVNINSKGVGRHCSDTDASKSFDEKFTFETEENRKFVKNAPISAPSYSRTLEMNDSKSEVTNVSSDKWVERKVVKNVVKKRSDSNTGLNETNEVSDKRMKRDHVSVPTQNSTYNNIPNGNKQEDNNSLNLADNLNFPALAGGPMPTAVPRLSYSDIAKKVIPVTATPKMSTDKKDMGKTQLTEDEKRILKKRQKKEKRKMKVKLKKQEAKAKMGDTKEEDEERVEKASDREVKFDLSHMFTTLLKVSSEKKSQKSKLKKATGIISVVPGLAKKNTPGGKKVERNKYGTTSTIMDGNTPIRKRGKERETPKKKRPTLLKKVITAERERRRLLIEKSSSVEVGDTNKEEEPAQEGNITDIENVDGDAVEYIPGIPEEVWKQIHSKKFREYCDHVLTKDINQLTYNLLVTLQKFQDRVYHENPTKYKQKRRFILGLREVLKHLKLKRLKAVIIAPNIERISSKGGLDDYLGSILSLCNEQDLPKIFAMNRHVLGRIIKKLAPVSVVGIFDYDGAHEIFKELMTHVASAKGEYTKKVNGLKDENTTAILSPGEPRTDVIPDLINNAEQKKKTKMSNVGNKVNQRVLDRLSIREYKPFDGDSESDAWVTDNEGAPC